MADVSIIDLISNSQKSKRIEGLNKLKSSLDKDEKEKLKSFVSYVKSQCEDFEEKTPLVKESVILIATSFLLFGKDESLNEIDETIFDNLKEISVNNLYKDYDLNSRQTSGSFLGALCKRRGLSKYKGKLENEILSKMEEMCKQSSHFHFTSHQFKSKSEKNSPCSPPSTPPSSPNFCSTSKDIFSHTASWKFLDTYLYTLQKIVTGCGTSFGCHVNERMLHILGSVLEKEERFVRESCCHLLGAFISQTDVYNYWNQSNTSNPQEPLPSLLLLFISLLQKSLVDPWPDVRMPSCVATRQLLVASKSNNGTINQHVLKLLLPYICFNRYSPAEGLQRFSQETWMFVTEGKGKEIIETHFDGVINLYSSLLSNPCTSEISDIQLILYYCLSELVKKIQFQLLEPHIENITDKILGFQDNNQQLLSEARVQLIINIFKTFPHLSNKKGNEVKNQSLILLESPLPSIRDLAAILISTVVERRGEGEEVKDNGKGRIEMIDEMVGVIREGFNTLKSPEETKDINNIISNSTNSPNNTNSNDTIDTNNKTNYNVTKPNIIFVGFSQQPNVSINRSAEVWEVADGCVCLLKRLNENKDQNIKKKLSALIPILADLMVTKKYENRLNFIEFTFTHLGKIFENFGVQTTKRNIEMFFDVFFEFSTPSSSSSSSSSTHEACVECIRKISGVIGKSILEAKLKTYDQNFADKIIKFL